MTPIDTFKGMGQAEKEAYLKDLDRLELLDMFQKGRDEKFDANDVPLLCRRLKIRMVSAHEMRQIEFVEKAILVLSCGNENHLKNFHDGMSAGFIHPDVAARAFDQLINDYKILIEKF